MANVTGYTSLATPTLSMNGVLYWHRYCHTSALGPDQRAALASKLYVNKAGRAPQRFGPNVVLNRVWDTSVNRYVTWETSLPDAPGRYYPGPGVYSTQTTGWCVVDLRAK